MASAAWHDKPHTASANRFGLFAWGVLAYDVAVILWGAYVRATGSGAGCGNHWPLCNGQIIPQAANTQMLIEFSHRVSSGLALVLVAALLAWAWRAFPGKHPVRTAALFAGLFTITEALVGAGLVLFQLVAGNTSVTRALFISVHLLNTFLLLSALTLTGYYSSGGQPIQRHGHTAAMRLLAIAFLGVLFVGMSGAITALGDTLFPSGSLAEGLAQDLSPTAQFFVRLRVYHPLIAVVIGVYVMFVARSLGAQFSRPDPFWMGAVLNGLVFVQWIGGAINLVLLAPLWMQLVHLLLADLVWIALVLFAATVLAQDSPPSVAADPLSVDRSLQ